MDLILGLLQPSSGQILIDGSQLSFSNPTSVQAWRSCVSHVPQNIFLSDSTIAENIAFGCEKQKIDFSLVRQCAEIAQLSTFIEDRRDGYNSIVGERGISLSDGQRRE